MANIGIFRTATSSAPGTMAPLTAKVTRRATTTATNKIKQSGQVINITGYTTVGGNARSGVTPAVPGVRQSVKVVKSNQVKGINPATPSHRAVRGLFK